MSKVEDFAIKKYPISIKELYGHKVDVNLWQRKACVEGYHQAEKDLELTWEDIDTIYNLLSEEFNYQLECGKRPQKEACQEVLKRFKDYKTIC